MSHFYIVILGVKKLIKKFIKALKVSVVVG